MRARESIGREGLGRENAVSAFSQARMLAFWRSFYISLFSSKKMNIFNEVIRPELLGKTPLDQNLTFAVKANIGSGHRASASTPSLRDWVPDAVSPVVISLLEDGHQLVAISNMHELAFGITSENPAFGDVENPRNPGYIAGGSSGGSAAAVAMNAVSFALGTDTGGSMRIPAALCGVVGYRPTTGLYSAEVVCPLSSTTDTIGVFAQHVTTVQKVHHSIVPSYKPQTRALPGVRIGVPRKYYYDLLDGEVEKVTDAALQSFKEAGIELVEVDIGFATEGGLTEDALGLFCYETAHLLPKYLEDQKAPVSFEELCEGIGDPKVKGIVETCRGIPEDQYRQYQERARKVRQQFDDYFTTNRLDGFIVPTTILPAVERPSPKKIKMHPDKEADLTFKLYMHNSLPQSIAGVPCISIPSGLSSDGRPIGLELVALQGEDSRLLDLAAAIQAALPPLKQLLFEDFKDYCHVDNV